MAEQNFAGSVNAGAPAGPENSNVSGRPNELQIGNMKYTEKDVFELQKKITEQGEELGQHRKQIDELSPLLEKLQEMPDLVDMIVEGKVTNELVAAMAKGEITPEQAEAASRVHEEVKKDLGADYTNISPEEINKLLDKKVDDLVKRAGEQITSKITEADQIRELEEKTLSFIKNTPDYQEYAVEIEKYLDENDLTDVRIAYDAVKGRVLSEKLKKDEDNSSTDRAKEVAANVSGGGSMASGVIADENLLDKILPLNNVNRVRF